LSHAISNPDSKREEKAKFKPTKRMVRHAEFGRQELNPDLSTNEKREHCCMFRTPRPNYQPSSELHKPPIYRALAKLGAQLQSK
jgi:hypothetical protein